MKKLTTDDIKKGFRTLGLDAMINTPYTTADEYSKKISNQTSHENTEWISNSTHSDSKEEENNA